MSEIVCISPIDGREVARRPIAGGAEIGRALATARAARAVWALALFPMAGVFSMLYPSSIYLTASVWAFELGERRRWGWCGGAVGRTPTWWAVTV